MSLSVLGIMSITDPELCLSLLQLEASGGGQ